MPVIAVGAAVAASVVAGSAVAATVGGIAAISAVTAFEVVAAVGATVAAVGAVTRNKTLTMVGGAIGLIGGIGGLASSAGVFGATAASGAPIFGAAPAASTGSFAEGLAPDIAGQVGGAVDAGTFGGETAGMSVADAASADTIPFIANGLPPDGQDGFITLSSTSERVTDPATTLTEASKSTAIDPAKDLTAATDVTKGLINQPTVQPIGTTPAATSSGVDAGSFGDASTNPDFLAGQSAGKVADLNPAQYSGAADKGVFGNILKFANDNKNLVSGVMTVGGKFLEGAFSEVDPAKINALNAQAAANDAAAALTNQQRANLAMPKAVASSTPVTGAAQPIIPPRPAQGLINQVPLAPVTGAVA